MDAERIYFEERLADQWLLDQAIEIDGHLCVGVGGNRQGGFEPVPTARHGRRMIEVLRAYPARFPQLRYERAGRDYSGCVRWGGSPPEGHLDGLSYVIAEGRFYGYTEKAIRDHIARMVEYLAK